MIAFIRRQIRVGCRNGLIHDSRGDVNALGEYCNMLKDKLNAVISELNQANARIKRLEKIVNMEEMNNGNL